MSIKRRKEAPVKKACLDYLKILENQGHILWFDRINSGTIYAKGFGKVKIRKIALGREGTSDLYFLWNGGTVYVETKSDIGKLSEEQLRFKDAVECAGHRYWIIRDINDFMKRIELSFINNDGENE